MPARGTISSHTFVPAFSSSGVNYSLATSKQAIATTAIVVRQPKLFMVDNGIPAMSLDEEEEAASSDGSNRHSNNNAGGSMQTYEVFLEDPRKGGNTRKPASGTIHYPEPSEIAWAIGTLVNGELIVNVVNFWDGERSYEVHRFSLSNTAASGKKLQYSNEPKHIRDQLYYQLYNWWSAGAVYKGFGNDEGSLEKRPIMSRCVAYNKLTKDLNFYIVQVLMSTCNSPIIAFYICDLELYREAGWEGIPFQLLRIGESNYYILVLDDV